MPSIRIQSFDWHAFETLIAPPATLVAQRIVRSLGKRWRPRPEFPCLPASEADFVAHVASRLAAEDWYRDPRQALKPPRPQRSKLASGTDSEATKEALFMEFLVTTLFHRPFGKELRLKYLQHEGGIDAYYLLLATHEAKLVVDQGRGRPVRYVVTSVGRERSDLTELLSLGHRPHRHPTWDPKANAAQMKENDPFQPGGALFYEPLYSIHSPAQVHQLLAELASVRDIFRDVPDEVREHMEMELFRPVETAARSKQAIYATNDY